ncbi:hypothetical protein J4573_30560 [Actinomadura barringtoniae]|uniref:Uncharacterized protein n=1 Tax=Actinomadura barringtoniae TaxID=1427535 RepID=A0A939PFR4_9ACTN|nr:hypothetical protein [Actinomadura barringtoniae]MBO2451468.1 hypothetical protein [Actinomadura barringtoniae]
MTYELVVWHEAVPVTREEALAASEKAAPHAGVAAFAKDLAERAPGLDVSVNGRAVVRMADEQADEVSALVYGLARAYELTCYDVDRELVLNLGPLGASREMQLHTGDGMQVVDPDLGLVRDALERISPQNPFAALVVFGQHFIQVSPEAGGYELEYKDSVAGTLSRTDVSALPEVQQAFEEYATGSRAFLDRFAWT